MSNSTIKRGLRDLKKYFKNKRRVSSLVLKIYRRVNNIKKAKRQPIKN